MTSMSKTKIEPTTHSSRKAGSLFGITVNRHFTSPKKRDGGVTYLTSHVKLTDYRTGRVLFDSPFEHPAQMSPQAVQIMATKYARRAGVPSETVRVDLKGVPVWLRPSVAAEGASLGRETSASQIFHRMAGTWTYWGWIKGYFTTEEDARAYYDEMVYMLATQMAAPNSPQWFNTGLNWAYGIDGPAQGHVYGVDLRRELASSTVLRDPAVVAREADGQSLDCQVLTVPSDSAYGRPQPHACFIQSVSDTLLGDGGIMDLWTREARLFKYGSGTGSNFSNLRGEGEALSGGGKSSGVMSFLNIGDAAAGSIKSGGTTRRAAKMVILNVDHPDIEKFVSWKVHEESKVAALVAGAAQMKQAADDISAAYAAAGGKENDAYRLAIKNAMVSGVPAAMVQRIVSLVEQGVEQIDLPMLDTNWDGEAYRTVGGQNSNNTVRVDDAFMQAVETGGDYNLIRRTDGEIDKTVPARSLWYRIAIAAWASADPGLQYDTTINAWHTCPVDGRINGSNPCSEYMFLDDTACNLASLNLVKFRKSNGLFDVDGFEAAVRLWQITLDIAITMAQYPSAEVAEGSLNYRTTGLGFANIGGLLMSLGLGYDSDEGRAVAASITALMGGVTYRTSCELAEALETFPRFEANRTDMLRVLRNHRAAAYEGEYAFEGLNYQPPALKLFPRAYEAPIVEAARAAWDAVVERATMSGVRNAQTTVLAPTGTIGLVMDCDTTGIEPDFALKKFKQLAGGGYMAIANQAVPAALTSLGYSQDQIAEITAYVVGHRTLEGAPHVLPAKLKGLGFTAGDIDAIWGSLETGFNLDTVFSPFALSDATKNGISLPGDVSDGRGVLRHVGFTDAEIAEANDWIFGNDTVEGAPYLRAEHLAVFDTANRCGVKGTRFLSWRAHIDMMAVCQPFLSGAISKTVNMPADATVDDVREAYRYSWQSGVKAVALYRDGSKLSQPLMSIAGIEVTDDYTVEEKTRIVSQMARELGLRFAGERRRLADSRDGNTQKAVLDGHKMYIRTGEYEDGTLGEIFIDMHKEGSPFRGLMNNFAVAISIGLQFGVPLEEYVEAFANTRFEPAGLVHNHSNLRQASSLLDLVFRHLAFRYLGREDMVHVPTPTSKTDLAPREARFAVSDRAGVGETSNASASATVSIERATSGENFTGNSCSNCGSLKMIRSGTCETCSDCGTTTGC